jgi:hypothetical protein
MWEFLIRQLLKEVGRTAASKFFGNEANRPEAYADRIKRDFHLHDYADAWALYNSDPAYWERWYAPQRSSAWNTEIQHDSARAAGTPSRYNVLEYGYPELDRQPPTAAAGTQSTLAKSIRRQSSPMLDTRSAAPLAPGYHDSFNDRVGNRTFPQVNTAGAASRNIRVLSSYPVAPDGSRLPSPNPSQTQRQLGQPLGSVTRDPMPDYPVRSPMSGLPDTSVAPGDDNMDDWFSRWLKPLAQQ